MGEANINDCYTPVGTFTIDKAFGLADDPGCQMEYTKVESMYEELPVPKRENDASA